MRVLLSSGPLRLELDQLRSAGLVDTNDSDQKEEKIFIRAVIPLGNGDMVYPSSRDLTCNQYLQLLNHKKI